jgi:hypothetical protein
MRIQIRTAIGNNKVLYKGYIVERLDRKKYSIRKWGTFLSGFKTLSAVKNFINNLN